MAKRTPPNTLASLAGGNQPASLIDQNFGATVYGDTTVTQNNVPLWGDTVGEYITTGLPTTPASGTIAKIVGVDGSNKLPAVDASNLLSIPAGTIRTYISGYTLSNDGSTPNSVLDIAAGTCADSTNATMIALASAFTKSTGGSWTSGTGQNGMGIGLTIANTTTYHVYAIINNSLTDIYFDTSATAANKPVGTTYFRRIGSFITDGTAHIRTFIQDGNDFQWMVPNTNPYSSGTNPGTSALTATLDVPSGIRVRVVAQINTINTGSGGQCFALVTDLSTTDTAPTASLTDTSAAETTGGGANTAGTVKNVWSNTSAQVRGRVSFSDASVTLKINTLGWMDPRGQNS